MSSSPRRKSTRGSSVVVKQLRRAVIETLEPRRMLSTSYALNTLATFNGTNGAEPVAGLVADGSGNLYGTTQTGGTGDSGAGHRI